MKSASLTSIEQQMTRHAAVRPTQTPVRPDFLHLVTAGELEGLKQAIVRRSLPMDFEAKLTRLAHGDLTHRFVERNCRLFAALLLAVQHDIFGASKADCERLLRVLAYARKDDDSIA